MSHIQDLAAEPAHWRGRAREAGPGWRVWRWEEPTDDGRRLVWRFRLLAPGEKPDGLGDVIPL